MYIYEQLYVISTQLNICQGNCFLAWGQKPRLASGHMVIAWRSHFLRHRNKRRNRCLHTYFKRSEKVWWNCVMWWSEEKRDRRWHEKQLVKLVNLVNWGEIVKRRCKVEAYILTIERSAKSSPHYFSIGCWCLLAGCQSLAFCQQHWYGRKHINTQ